MGGIAPSGPRCVPSSQNSTITGTLAGQIVMEGFLNIRLPMWLRRLVTRLIAARGNLGATRQVFMVAMGGFAGLLVVRHVLARRNAKEATHA